MMLDCGGIRKILVRTPNWVGDVVMSLPALDALKSNFPDSSLTVIAKPWVRDLLENYPAVNEILVYDVSPGALPRLKSILEMRTVIRKANFDMAVLFQNAFEAALLAWLGRVRYRIGYPTDGRGILLTHKISKKRHRNHIHQVEYYLHILRSLGLEAPTKNPKLEVEKTAREKARQFVSELGIRNDNIVVGVGPGAMYGEAKRWPFERFAQVADMAAANWQANILIFGSEKEKEICEGVQRAMSHQGVNLCGKTSLREAVELLSICDFFITNDSGLMHVSASLGVPTLAIFGSTDPEATGPRGPKTRVVHHKVECAPCLARTCERDFSCMLSVEVGEVWRELERLRVEVGI